MTLSQFLKIFEEVNKRVRKWPKWQKKLLESPAKPRKHLNDYKI